MEHINNNGFNYVDLKLPSDTLWATCNVGAKNPSDYGLYFAWGDTKGYTKEQIEKDKPFSYAKYKWSVNGSNYKFSANPPFSKYVAPIDMLSLEDDAAHANMGGDWHMPSSKQISELFDNTTQSWELHNLDNVKGMRFTSKQDTSKSIFIPAAGYAQNGSISGSRSIAGVWSSMLHTYYIHSAQYLYFYSSSVYINIVYRYFGFSVRGVLG